MAARSQQAKILNRRLTAQLARDLAVFTVVFALAALVANTFLVPRLADLVADATSEWQTYVYSDFSANEALAATGATAYAVAQSWEEANDLMSDEVVVSRIEESQGIVREQDSEGGDVESQGDQEAEKASSAAISATGGSSQSVEGSLADMGFPPLTDADLARLAQSGALGSGTLLLCSFEGTIPHWVMLRDLQSMAASNALSAYDPDFPHQWQVIYGEDHVSARYLSAYNAIKAFKYPVVIIVYLVGFAIITFLGFGRSLRYFDELSGAVGSIIAHRDQPVKLSKPLLSTQQELEAIRLSSLADERAAQAAERRKDELVAYLAHDVKTPLTSVIGYLSLLDEAPDMPEESRKRYIATALGKSERLEELIDEFFEITRYNLQAIPIERAQVDVRLFCQQVVEEFYPEAESRGLTIGIDAPESEMFFVDPDKFARAFGNVVRNAIAYADPNTAISITMEKTDEDSPRWRLSVTDTGREISPAHLESIFDKFYRESSARSSSEGRAGLGLAIAKEIVLAHGGTIEAQSAQGQTTFTIHIPA